MDLLIGQQPTTTTKQIDPIPHPGQDFAKIFWEQIVPMLLQQELPSFPGQVNPGLSPYMQNTMGLGAAAYGQSMSPYLQGTSGALGASGGGLPKVSKPPGDPNAGGLNPWSYGDLKTAGR